MESRLDGKTYPTYSTDARADAYFDFNGDKTLIADALFAGRLKGLVNLNGLYVDPDTGLLDATNVIVNTTRADGIGDIGEEPDKIIIPKLLDATLKKYTMYYYTGTVQSLTAKTSITVDDITYTSKNGKYYRELSSGNGVEEAPKSKIFKALQSEENSFYHNGLIYSIPNGLDEFEFATITIGNAPSGLGAKYHGKYYNGMSVNFEFVKRVTLNNIETTFF